MKKIFLVLAAVSLLFASCLKSDPPETDPMIPALLMYSAVSFQNIAALDPFSVAFRLNSLLTEAEGNDFENIVPATKEKFFGTWTKISYEASSGVYTIEFTGGAAEGDYLRSGKLFIHTNGNPVLTDEAVWDISTETDKPYAMSLSDASLVNINLVPDTDADTDAESQSRYKYSIRTKDLHEWEVKVTDFDSWVNSSSLHSNWGCTYTISHDGASQLPGAIEAAKYYVYVGTSSDAKTFLLGDRISVTTQSPIVYSAKCGWGVIVSGGEITISLSDISYTSEGYCIVQWTETDNDCKPGTYIYYNGYEKTY